MVCIQDIHAHWHARGGQRLLLFFHFCPGSGDQIQTIGLWSKCFYPLSPFAICSPCFWLTNLTWHEVHGATVIHYYVKNIRDYTDDRDPSWIYQGGNLTLLQQGWETGVERPDRASGAPIMKENYMQDFEEYAGRSLEVRHQYYWGILS